MAGGLIISVINNNIKIALISIQCSGNRVVSIGLVSIATFIEHNLGIKNITIIDKNFVNVQKEILKINPDIIGISAMTPDYTKAIELARWIKSCSIQKIPIILGGFHISTLPESLDKSFDIGVIGAGEITFADLVKLYIEGMLFDADCLRCIKGICF
jgi:radical SAM superfamily enzyme YgiQ (UPF0313 family)